MYDKLNITENVLRVLSLFTDDFSSAYYIREVEKLLNISPRTAQLILADLESKGIIGSMIKGKIKSYELSNNELSKRYLSFVEQYKAITFLNERPLIREIIEQITPHVNGVGVIFGSYVKCLEKKNSDLDIFVAGNFNKDEIDKISKMFGMIISVKCYPLKLFKQKVRTDILLKEVLKNHVVFLNAELFVGSVLNDG